jgi:hypothetical protein
VASSYNRAQVREALALLGIGRLALRLANASFPSLVEEDIGCGSPYSHGGRAFVRFIHDLGFDTLVLAPQGQTRPSQPSPYVASVFSRSLLSLAALPLSTPRVGLVSPQHVQRLVAGSPARHGGAKRNSVDFPYAWNGVLGLLEGALGALDQSSEELKETFRRFVDSTLLHGSWLQRDALFYALTQTHVTEDIRRWPELDQTLFGVGHVKPEAQLRRIHTKIASHRRLVESYCFGQFLLRQQHEALHAETRSLGLALFAETNDNSQAIDPADCWAYGTQMPSQEIRLAHLLDGFDGLIPGGIDTSNDWVEVTAGDLPLAEQLVIPFEMMFPNTDQNEAHQGDSACSWSTRVPENYAQQYPRQARQGVALDLRQILASALRKHDQRPQADDLARALERDATS